MTAIPLPIGCYLFSIDAKIGSGEVLGVAVDPSLSLDSMMGSLAGVPSSQSLLKGMVVGGKVEAGKSMLVVEGIPPVPVKIVEAIHSWEYVEVGTLLMDTTPKPEEWISTTAQVVVVHVSRSS